MEEFLEVFEAFCFIGWSAHFYNVPVPIPFPFIPLEKMVLVGAFRHVKTSNPISFFALGKNVSGLLLPSIAIIVGRHGQVL